MIHFLVDQNQLKHHKSQGVGGQTYFKGWGVEEDVCGLCDISSVQRVVVWHVFYVVVLQCHHEGDEGLGRNIERLQQISFLCGRK